MTTASWIARRRSRAVPDQKRQPGIAGVGDPSAGQPARRERGTLGQAQGATAEFPRLTPTKSQSRFLTESDRTLNGLKLEEIVPNRTRPTFKRFKGGGRARESLGIPSLMCVSLLRFLAGTALLAAACPAGLLILLAQVLRECGGGRARVTAQTAVHLRGRHFKRLYGAGTEAPACLPMRTRCCRRGGFLRPPRKNPERPGV